MPNDDIDKVARLKPTPHPGRGRPEAQPTGDAGRGQVIQVATRCASLDEFVEKFAGFAWESSLVLPAASALPVGTQGRFVILLRDQSVAMRGRCRVTEAKQTPVSSRNPAVKRIMMRVALLEMDEASRAVHKRLIALRSAPVPLPIPTEPSETTQIEPTRQGSAPVAVPVPPPVAAVPVAPSPVAAAPAVPVPPTKTPPPAPPVNLNRTMIGVGIGPDGRAYLSRPSPVPIPPQPAPADEITEARARIPTLPRVETRAPGSPYTLPANPLSELGADDVDSFIECTLLEADADMPTGIADAPPPQAEGHYAADASAPRETAHVRQGGFAAKLPPALRGKALRIAPYAAIAVVGVVIGFALRGKPPAPPAVAVAPAPEMKARVPEPEIQGLEATIEAPVQAAIPARAQPAPTADKPARPAAPTRPIADLETATVAPAKPAAPVKAAPAEKPAAQVKVAPAEKPAAPVKVAPAEKPAAPVKVAPADEPAPQPIAMTERPAAQQKLAAAEKPAPAAKPAVPAEAPAEAPAAVSGEPGACTAHIVTEPKDVKVIWGGQLIGNSPIDAARVPCGPAKVTLERERWQVVTVDVNAQAGAASSVHERLRRPRGTLDISSSPPGAQIFVNRVAAGASPKQIDVQRYEKVPIKATLKGYQPWTKTIYLKDTEAKIDIQMVPRK